MNHVLIVSGHTDLSHSFANKLILERLKERLPDAEFDYLDKEYPDFTIDAAKEQDKLVRADVIVLQFPVFWYSFPSLMHRWMEDVFVHGFSHGSQGKALHGKKLVASFTTGAPESMYTHGGPQLFSISELIEPPLKSTAHLCGMDYAGMIYTGNLSYASRPDAEKLKDMKKRALAHADRLVAVLKTLED